MKTKLIIESWRRFLKEEQDKNYKGPPLQYSSVVLDDNSVTQLSNAADEIKKNNEKALKDFDNKGGTLPHHMTINMGSLLDGWTNDEKYTLTVDGWGMVDGQDKKGKKVRAMAFRISKQGMPNIKNKTAHITALIPSDGKANHSNQITIWNDLGPMEVSGIVVEQTPQKKKEKKKQRQKQTAQSPQDFAITLAKRGLEVDKIKNIMSQKFSKVEKDVIDAAVEDAIKKITEGT